MKKMLILVLLVSVALAGFLIAKGVWEKKPYTQWNEKEARAVLEKSPWVYVFSYGRTGEIGNNVRGIRDSEDTIPSEREFITFIHMRLFSARPIRQAYAASNAKGDAQRFEQFKAFAEQKFEDEIVISWTVSSSNPGATTVMDVTRKLYALSAGELKQETFLAANTGKKVYLKDYMPPGKDGTGAKFIFPRDVSDGVPLIDETTKSIKFQTIPFVLKNETVQIDGTFKLKDMLFDGKIEF